VIAFVSRRRCSQQALWRQSDRPDPGARGSGRTFGSAQLRAHRSAPARPVIGWAPTLDPLVLLSGIAARRSLALSREGSTQARECRNSRMRQRGTPLGSLPQRNDLDRLAGLDLQCCFVAQAAVSSTLPLFARTSSRAGVAASGVKQPRAPTGGRHADCVGPAKPSPAELLMHRRDCARRRVRPALGDLRAPGGSPGRARRGRVCPRAVARRRRRGCCSRACNIRVAG
jgi:hypothetical protein